MLSLSFLSNVMVKQTYDMHQWPSGEIPEAFVWNAISSTGLSQLKLVYQSLDITGRFSFGGTVVHHFK
jgi:hypothetical protein